MLRTIGVVALVGCVSEGPPTRDDGCPVGLEEGQCPPDFSLPSVDGGTVTLSELVPRRVVVIGSSLW